jgi:hypothetical protein
LNQLVGLGKLLPVADRSSGSSATRSRLAPAVLTRLLVAALTGYQLPDGHLKGFGEIEEPLVQQTPSALLDVDQNVAGDT